MYCFSRFVISVRAACLAFGAPCQLGPDNINRLCVCVVLYLFMAVLWERAAGTQLQHEDPCFLWCGAVGVCNGEEKCSSTKRPPKLPGVRREMGSVVKTYKDICKSNMPLKAVYYSGFIMVRSVVRHNVIQSGLLLLWNVKKAIVKIKCNNI